MTFAAKVALITREASEIVEAAVRLVTALGVGVGLLYGVSEEPESKVHGRLLWPWNKARQMCFVLTKEEGQNGTWSNGL